MKLLKLRHKLTRKEQKRYEKEEFEARLQMETNAQRHLTARLQHLELIAENQLRLKK